MNDVILDSSIVIDYLRGHTLAGGYLNELDQQPHTTLFAHAVTIAEVLSGARNRHELLLLDQVLSRFTFLAPDHNDHLLSITLLKQHRLGSGVGWLDCLLAATSLRLSIPVATLNVKHFKVFSQLQVIKPY